MKKLLIVFSLCSLIFVECETARAQYRPNPIGSIKSPAWSPYLNLFRRGNSSAFNYFSLVRPELEFRNQFQQVQQQFGTVQQNLSSLQQQQQRASGLPPTGIPVGFMTHSRYFMNLQGGGTSGGFRAPTGSNIQQPTTSGGGSITPRSSSRFAAPSTASP